jgi:putative transposase
MKRSRFTDSRIIEVWKQAEVGTPVPDLCREYGVRSATFYKWRAKRDWILVFTQSGLITVGRSLSGKGRAAQVTPLFKLNDNVREPNPHHRNICIA